MLASDTEPEASDIEVHVAVEGVTLHCHRLVWLDQSGAGGWKGPWSRDRKTQDHKQCYTVSLWHNKHGNNTNISMQFN